jgi:hypothetical protein
VRGRALQALRAVALHPRGLRLSAHPSAMPALIVLGYVVKRQARWDGAKVGEKGYFLTPAGLELLKALGGGGDRVSAEPPMPAQNRKRSR